MHPPTLEAGVLRARLGCDGEGELLAGHYPGEPLLPGVCLVDAAAAILARETGAATLGRVERLRLFRRIHPGDLVDLTFVPAQPGWRVAADIAGERVARFTLLLDVPVALDDAPAPVDAVAVIAAADIATMLPHRCPMLLVDAAVSGRGDAVLGRYRVSVNAPWFAGLPRAFSDADWPLPRALVIESFLQTAGLLFPTTRAAEANLIVSAIGAAAFIADAPLGETLVHRVAATRMFDAAALVSGVTHCGDRVIARFADILVALQPSADPAMQPAAATQAPIFNVAA